MSAQGYDRFTLTKKSEEPIEEELTSGPMPPPDVVKDEIPIVVEE